jgi:hypothetical protein
MAAISLNELYQVRQMKDHSKKTSYERVLELAHRRIRNVNSYGGMNTFYEIPGMLVGYPLFNIHDCLAYVVEQLRGAGFLVQILPPPHVCVVYISWDPNEIKPTRKRLTGGADGGSSRRTTLPALAAPTKKLNNGKYF